MARKRQPRIRVCEQCGGNFGSERGPAAKTCSEDCQRLRNIARERARYERVKHTEEWKLTRASYLDALTKRKAADTELKDRLVRAHRLAVARYKARIDADPYRRAAALEYKRDRWKQRVAAVNCDPALRDAALQRQRDWYHNLTAEERERIFYAPRRWRSYEREILARLELAVQKIEKKAAVDWAIRNQKLSNWSGDEIRFLRDNYARMQASEIAKIVKRTVPAVQRMAGRMGLLAQSGRRTGGGKFDPVRVPWTLMEDRILRELYGRFTARELAEALGRSLLSVKGRIHKQRLNQK